MSGCTSASDCQTVTTSALLSLPRARGQRKTCFGSAAASMPAAGGGGDSSAYLKFMEHERARLATENEELRARVEQAVGPRPVGHPGLAEQRDQGLVGAGRERVAEALARVRDPRPLPLERGADVRLEHAADQGLVQRVARELRGGVAVDEGIEPLRQQHVDRQGGQVPERLGAGGAETGEGAFEVAHGARG